MAQAEPRPVRLRQSGLRSGRCSRRWGGGGGGAHLQTCLRPPTLFQARHKTITSTLKPSNLASGTPTLALATLPLTHVKGQLRPTPPKDYQPLRRTVASPWGAEVGGGRCQSFPYSPHFLCERSPQPAQRQQPLQGQTFVCSRVPAPQHFLTEECVVLTTNPRRRRVGWTGWPHRGDGAGGGDRGGPMRLVCYRRWYVRVSPPPARRARPAPAPCRPPFPFQDSHGLLLCGSVGAVY